MSKGLEALKEMCDEAVSVICRYIPSKAHKEVAEWFDKRKSIIEKELKALEIIKNKYLDPHDFVLCYYTMNNEKWIDYEEYKKAYLNYYENDEYMLTQEEYDLLEEVLL